jgi:protease-4
VFGLVPNAQKLMEQKLGLKTETVKTNTNADFPSLLRPKSPYEKEIMQMSIEKVYTDFVSKVAEGRKMKNEAVDSIGQGRVWSGVNAMKIGLIDEIGGLEDAISGAAELAGLSTYTVKELPALEDPYTKLLSQLGGEVKMNFLKQELGESARLYDILKEVREMEGIQARLPYFLELR